MVLTRLFSRLGRPLLKTRVIMKTTIRRLIESEASGCAADPPESDN